MKTIRHLLGEGGAGTADSMCAEYTLPPPSSQQKLTLKSLISSRTVRAYLLEREEYLLKHPDHTRQLIEAVRSILNAVEGRAV